MDTVTIVRKFLAYCENDMPHPITLATLESGGSYGDGKLTAWVGSIDELVDGFLRTDPALIS